MLISEHLLSWYVPPPSNECNHTDYMTSNDMPAEMFYARQLHKKNLQNLFIVYFLTFGRSAAWFSDVRGCSRSLCFGREAKDCKRTRTSENQASRSGDINKMWRIWISIMQIVLVAPCHPLMKVHISLQNVGVWWIWNLVFQRRLRSEDCVFHKTPFD